MKTHPDLSKEEFEALLNWFSTDSDTAGEEYERIRKGLVRFFHFRGCSDALSLADETINRVAIRLNSLEISEDTKKISIFYGFALNVFREYIRVESNQEVFLINDFAIDTSGNTAEESEDVRFDCLKLCLESLITGERDLITGYFSRDKSEKIQYRKCLANDLEISATTLHVRIYRIKAKLRNCVEKCLKKKKL